jgi:hypothetical protein
MTTYGLLIFDGAEELDFAGPWEVFTVSAMLRDQGDTAVLIAERPDVGAALGDGLDEALPWAGPHALRAET